jgi:F-type H+-transporting ATPase subunit c
MEINANMLWIVQIVSIFSASLAISIAAFGGAAGQGKAAASAVDAIARQPEAGDRIFTSLILSLALIESLVIYALAVALVLIFANPFTAQLVKYIEIVGK